MTTPTTPTASTASTASTAAEHELAPRLSNPVELVPELAEINGLLFRAANGPVPRTTLGLLHLRAGQIVGNTYLTVMHTGNLRRLGETDDRITAVASWRDAPHFSAAERAALALVDAVLTASPHGERVPDDLFAHASAWYDEKGIATLIMAISQVCFYIPLALIGKPTPGATQQWRE